MREIIKEVLSLPTASRDYPVESVVGNFGIKFGATIITVAISSPMIVAIQSSLRKAVRKFFICLSFVDKGVQAGPPDNKVKYLFPLHNSTLCRQRCAGWRSADGAALTAGRKNA